LKTVPALQRIWLSFEPSSAASLAPPPALESLWKKKRAPLTPIPVVAAKSAEKAEPKEPARSKAAPAGKAARAKSRKNKIAGHKAKPRKQGKTGKQVPVAQSGGASAAPSLPERTLPPAPQPIPAPLLRSTGPAEAHWEARSLVESLREWRKLEQEMQPVHATDPLPQRPQIAAVPHSKQQQEAAQPAAHALELRLTLSRPFLAVAGALLAVFMAGLVFLWSQHKTRDLEGARLPDPSSPTVEPSGTDDPFPALKAPTRPERE
jgi:hypothetical protein